MLVNIGQRIGAASSANLTTSKKFIDWMKDSEIAYGPLFPLEDEIKGYFNNFTEFDNTDYLNLKEMFTSKIQEVYDECMPEGKEKFDIKFYE